MIKFVLYALNTISVIKTVVISLKYITMNSC